jgi:hypothetical protein
LPRGSSDYRHNERQFHRMEEISSREVTKTRDHSAQFAVTLFPFDLGQSLIVIFVIYVFS